MTSTKIGHPATIPFLLLQGALLLIRSPRLLLLCAVPYAIGLLCFFTTLFFAYQYRADAAALIISDPSSFWFPVVAWFAFALSIAASALVGLLGMFTLGGFFLELYVEKLLLRRGISVPEHSSVGEFVGALLRGLQDDLMRLVYVLLVSLLTLVFGFIPLLFFIPPFVAALLAGYDLFDIPLTLLEVRLKDKIRLAKRHWVDVLILGALFLLALAIPLAGILLLPLYYYAAVERLASWEIKASA